MLRMNVPTMSGKSCCWNGFMVFWNVSIRLQDSEKSTYVDGVSGFSGIAISEFS
jgi:hypothetical protein